MITFWIVYFIFVILSINYYIDKNITSHFKIPLGWGRWSLCYIIKTKIEARSRKLKIGWTIELKQDLKYIHALDKESELVDILTEEINYE